MPNQSSHSPSFKSLTIDIKIHYWPSLVIEEPLWSPLISSNAPACQCLAQPCGESLTCGLPQVFIAISSPLANRLARRRMTFFRSRRDGWINRTLVSTLSATHAKLIEPRERRGDLNNFTNYANRLPESIGYLCIYTSWDCAI